MELRSEESPAIQPYTHSRKVEKVVVSLGEDISKIKALYLKVWLEGCADYHLNLHFGISVPSTPFYFLKVNTCTWENILCKCFKSVHCK